MLDHKPNPALRWPIPYEGVLEIARSEGLRLSAYPDPVSGGAPWTIGYGQTFRADGRPVRQGMVMTPDEADHEFCEILTDFTRGVQAELTAPTNDNQLAAMVSLAWNIGLAGFKRSTVLRAHNQGEPDAAARAFALWNKAGGKVIRGLTLRRAREAALYLTPVNEATHLPMPQEVEPESTLARSPIAQSGALTSAAGAVVASVSAVSEHVKDMGLNPLIAVGIILIVAGGIIVYNRIKQRREGWS